MPGNTRSCHQSDLKAWITPGVEKQYTSSFLLLFSMIVLDFLKMNIICVVLPNIFSKWLVFVDFPHNKIFSENAAWSVWWSCNLIPSFGKILWTVFEKLWTDGQSNEQTADSRGQSIIGYVGESKNSNASCLKGICSTIITRSFVKSVEYNEIYLFPDYFLVLHSDEWKGFMQYFTRF